MQNEEIMTMSFIVKGKHRRLLEEWSQEEDRSLSAVFRRLVEDEEVRKLAKRQVVNPSNK